MFFDPVSSADLLRLAPRCNNSYTLVLNQEFGPTYRQTVRFADRLMIGGPFVRRPHNFAKLTFVGGDQLLL
jgi:hypothetical protein